MIEKISSSMTYYYKVLLPAIWIGGFGFVTLSIWLGIFKQPSQSPEEVNYFVLFVFISSSVALLWEARDLKFVALDYDHLIIKNFTRTIRVPLRNLVRINESRLWRPKTIYLTFCPPCEFGEKVNFIPKAKLQMSFKLMAEHPIAIKLRELADIKD